MNPPTQESSIILIISISFISISEQRRANWMQFEASPIEIDRYLMMLKCQNKEDGQLMKRSFQSTITTNSKQSFDDGPKRMGFQSSGIYLKPDNKVKPSDNKINPANNNSNVNQANMTFGQINKTYSKINNNNQLNSTASSIQTSASSPIRREPILSPSNQILNKKAAQLFTNITKNQPQTAIFTNLMTPAPKTSTGNPQSALVTTSSLSSKNNAPPVQSKNLQQENIPSINPFIDACKTQIAQSDGGGRFNIGTNAPKQGNSVISVGKVGPNFPSSNEVSNSFSLSQNANNLSSILGKNVVTNGFTGQTSTIQSPVQDTFYNKNTSQNIILSQNNHASANSHTTADIHQQNLFQPQHQNPPIQQQNIKANKPSNNSQKSASKYTKVPTLTNNNNNNNHISLDEYFPSLSNQPSTQIQDAHPTINQDVSINSQPNCPTLPKALLPPDVPNLFDPNYHFQYISDPIFQQQMEIQMDELTVEQFIAKSTAQIVQVCQQLQQICNKCIGSLKERSQVGQICNIFYQLDRYILNNTKVSRELDLLESQQYEIEKSLTALEKMFPENCLHSLSYEMEDCRELEELVRGLTEQQQQNSPHFNSFLLLYQSLNAIEKRVKEMDEKLDLLTDQQQQ